MILCKLKDLLVCYKLLILVVIKTSSYLDHHYLMMIKTKDHLGHWPSRLSGCDDAFLTKLYLSFLSPPPWQSMRPPQYTATRLSPLQSAAWPAALLCQTAATLSSYFLLYTIQTKQQQSIQYLKVQIIKMLLNNNPGGRERSYTSIPNALEKIIHYQVFK